MTNFTHGMGWRRDIYDPRDFRIKMSREEMNKVSLPPAIELYTPPILDQKSTSSCTGFATASLYRYHLHQNFNEFQPSPLFNYWFGRHVPRLGWEDEDEGAMPRDVIQSMISNGVVAEEDWPFIENPKVVNQRPPQALLAKAKANKVLEGKYVRMLANDNLFHLKYSIAQGLPFLVGVDVYSSFFDTGDDGLVPMPQTNQTFEGGHLLYCLSGNTKIPLADGRELSIIELEREFGQSSFDVYTSREDGLIETGKAFGIRKTGANRRIVSVVLDNGESLRCTPDHLIMLRDGSYRRADELSAGDSLMPLYRKLCEEEGMIGYEMVFQPKKNEWEFTHRRFCPPIQKHFRRGVVHHENFIKRDNRPSNLKYMTWEEHTELHYTQTNVLQAYAKSPEGRKKSAELMNALWADPEWRESMIEKQRVLCKERSLKRSDSGEKLGFASWDKEKLAENGRCNGKLNAGKPLSEEHKRNSRDGRLRLFATNPEAKAKQAEVAVKNLQSYNKKLKNGEVALTEKQRNARRENATRTRSDPKNAEKYVLAQKKTTWKRFYIDLYPTFEEYLEAKPINHKVVAVIDAGYDDVYDLTCEPHHNLAVSSGIFVHNCNGFSEALQCFRCPNSWGTGWGDNGVAWIPYPYISNAGLAGDFWRIEAITG